jgi:putative transposase
MGELKKIKIKPPSRNTVKRILRDKGFDPSPKRSDSTWAQFLERHAKTLWQCDFLMKRVVTWRGIRYAYVLVWINIKSRRVYTSPVTFKPTQEWTAQQAVKTLHQIQDDGHQIGLVQFDHDTRFGKPFLDVLDRRAIPKLLTVYRSPNLNAYIERFIQTLQQECLDHFIVFGTKHFNYLVKEFLEIITKNGHISRWTMCRQKLKE